MLSLVVDRQDEKAVDWLEPGWVCGEWVVVSEVVSRLGNLRVLFGSMS